jgi:hypothetical protein
MTLRTASALACLMSLVVLGSASAQIPNSALPGRERGQILGKPGAQPGVPQIELQGGRPKSVFETKPATRPVKRRKCRGSKRC